VRPPPLDSGGEDARVMDGILVDRQSRENGSIASESLAVIVECLSAGMACHRLRPRITGLIMLLAIKEHVPNVIERCNSRPWVR